MHKVFASTIAAELKEIRAASTASGGTALTTTAALISIPLGADWVSITPRNFVGCAVARVTINPFLTIVTTTNALGTIGLHDFDRVNEPTALSSFPTQVISDEMQDGDTEDFAMDSFDVASNNDYIYIGSHLPFRGVAVDLGTNVNATASVLTVKFWEGDWANITALDGTASGGATMAVDGNVTWTVPTTWKRTSLVEIGDTSIKEAWSGANLYWTRWEVSAQTGANWDIAQLRALNRSTAYSELIEGQALECSIKVRGAIGCVEALTNAGTANLIVNAGVLETSTTGLKEGFE